MEFKNISNLGEVEVPDIRQIVQHGDTVLLDKQDARHAESFAQQPSIWEPVDKPAKDLAKKLSAPAEEPPVEGTDVEGNMS